MRSTPQTFFFFYTIAPGESEYFCFPIYQTAAISGHSSVQVSSVQEGIYALGKAHMRSTPSVGGFPNVTFETVLMFVL